MHECKGLFDHLYAVKPVVLGKPKRSILRGFDPWPLSHFWSGLHHGDHHPCQALTWQIKTTREQSLIVQLNDVPGVCLLLCNGKAVGLYGEEQSSRRASWALHPGPGNSPLKPAGTNELSLVLLQTELDDQSLNLITRGLSIYITQQNLTRDAQWAFAPWAIPDASTFVPMKGVKPGQPRWYRTEFEIAAASQSRVNSTALALTLQGMSKGQVYLNGRNLCRYWWGTMQGKPISGAGSLPIAIPSTLLHSDQPNQLLIFDEHGCSPSKVAIATS
ncbi:MAG: hypothetical protein HC898_11450 [Phycisphaerales bacterium]|nr:hypothetical protein [Phycisphaerales bacterium]